MRKKKKKGKRMETSGIVHICLVFPKEVTPSRCFGEVNVEGHVESRF